eukprot:364771-Chlamydomonas_euryale.AAC.9
MVRCGQWPCQWPCPLRGRCAPPPRPCPCPPRGSTSQVPQLRRPIAACRRCIRGLRLASSNSIHSRAARSPVHTLPDPASVHTCSTQSALALQAEFRSCCRRALSYSTSNGMFLQRCMHVNGFPGDAAMIVRSCRGCCMCMCVGTFGVP